VESAVNTDKDSVIVGQCKREHKNSILPQRRPFGEAGAVGATEEAETCWAENEHQNRAAESEKEVEEGKKEQENRAAKLDWAGCFAGIDMGTGTSWKCDYWHCFSVNHISVSICNCKAWK
jgi:hypothetical protein